MGCGKSLCGLLALVVPLALTGCTQPLQETAWDIVVKDTGGQVPPEATEEYLADFTGTWTFCVLPADVVVIATFASSYASDAAVVSTFGGGYSVDGPVIRVEIDRSTGTLPGHTIHLSATLTQNGNLISGSGTYEITGSASTGEPYTLSGEATLAGSAVSAGWATLLARAFSLLVLAATPVGWLALAFMASNGILAV